MTGMPAYPFVRLTEAKRRLLAAGADLIDFGIGEPREETPAFIRAALAEAIEPLSTYPQTEGLPELRAAISASRMNAGVSSRGSPTPKSMKSTPSAWSRRFASSRRTNG